MSRRKQKFPLHITGEDEEDTGEMRMECEESRSSCCEDSETSNGSKNLENNDKIENAHENQDDEVSMQVADKIKSLMVTYNGVAEDFDEVNENKRTNGDIMTTADENVEQNVSYMIDEYPEGHDDRGSTVTGEVSSWKPEEGLGLDNVEPSDIIPEAIHIDDSSLTIIEDITSKPEHCQSAFDVPAPQGTDTSAGTSSGLACPSLPSTSFGTVFNAQQVKTFILSSNDEATIRKTYFVPVSVNSTYLNTIPRESMDASGCRKLIKGQAEAPQDVKQLQNFICPVCFESFKSKRSFNSHILVHCQLVKGPNSNKRSAEEKSFPNFTNKKMSPVSKRRNTETERISEWVIDENSFLPLDLSCRKSCSNSNSSFKSGPIPSISRKSEPLGNPPPLILISNDETSSSQLPTSSCPESSYITNLTDNFINYKTSYSASKSTDLLTFSNMVNRSHLSSPRLPGVPGSSPCHSSHSDRDSSEDINENLANEARESEKDFYGNIQGNEMFLAEDSTSLEVSPLPLVGSFGDVKKVKVASDEGAPMVYKIKYHAEQMLVSRILGINEETGDKIELYKCFQCGLAFPSISRLQSHLSQHKQRFDCKKCGLTYDSRISFTQHIQKDHSIKDHKRGEKKPLDSFDERSAENTVTVAAILSALRENSICSVKSEPSFPSNGDFMCRTEENGDAEGSLAVSPSSFDGELTMGDEALNPDHDVDQNVDLNQSSSDIFKMFSCRFCGKKFDRAFSCNRHERVHTGFKPCFCRICGRGFSEPRNLRHHVIRFHSDGSLRHLIKRDRRKRREDGSYSPSTSPIPVFSNGQHENTILTSSLVSPISSVPIPILREMGNTSAALGDCILKESSHASMSHFGVKQEGANNSLLGENRLNQSEYGNIYTSNLTKIFAASLDKSSRSKKLTTTDQSSKEQFRNRSRSPIASGVMELASFSLNNHIPTSDYLEPGEIRLGLKTKIVDDVNSGRRLLLRVDEMEDDENGLGHSPQFSSYAPRLNIVESPVNRDQALLPITDDIGRTFYECPYCHKLFGSTSDLNRHLDFHEDLRPYNCEYCDYSARTNSQLKVHKMRHEGIKQFSCDICNYNGVTQSDLNRHKKTQSHVARTQNICNVCGLGFFSGSQKQVHIVQCHPEMEGASSLIQMSLGIPPPTSNDQI